MHLERTTKLIGTGISNPLEVLEQLTYLLFIRRLDELEALEERKSQRSGQAMARRQFPEGRDARDRPYDQLRWSRLKQLAGCR
jgi:type I restriction enzyme M protein